MSVQVFKRALLNTGGDFTGELVDIALNVDGVIFIQAHPKDPDFCIVRTMDGDNIWIKEKFE